MNEVYMKMALKNAKLAYDNGDVPVGAIIVCDNEVIASTYNRKFVDKNSLHHAELLAIEEACQRINDWHLNKCSIYVTLEPCPMCASAIVQSRFGSVIYGSSSNDAFNHDIVERIFSNSIIVYKNVCEKECTELIKKFFASIR